MTSRPTFQRRLIPNTVPEPARARLVICLALYGGAMGAGSLLVNFISRTKYPQIPEHMPPAPTAFLSGGAFVVCALLGGLLAYWLAGSAEETHLRRLLKWIVAVGFAFGILSPVLAGASLPMSTVFLNLYKDVITIGDVPLQMVGALFRAPSFALTHGILGLYTGLLAGALFGVGGWMINEVIRSQRKWLSEYGGYALAILLSALFYGISTLAPATALERYG